MAAVDDVFAYLQAQSFAGPGTNWTILRRRQTDAGIPSPVDQLVVVSEDGGALPEIQASEGIGDSAMRDIGVQVYVRAAAWDGDASVAKALEILDALHSLRHITLGSTSYLRVRATTPEPTFLGFDEQGRPAHTVTFMLLRQAA